MRLNERVDHVQFFFETVGYLQFSAFYSANDLSKGELVQKVARATAGIFVLLSFFDFFMMRPLPFAVRLIVNGSLIALISSLGVSLLLKGIQKILNESSEEEDEDVAHTSKRVIFSKANVTPYVKEFKDSGPFTPSPSPVQLDDEEWERKLSHARRNLLPEFERISKEEACCE